MIARKVKEGIKTEKMLEGACHVVSALRCWVTTFNCQHHYHLPAGEVYILRFFFSRGIRRRTGAEPHVVALCEDLQRAQEGAVAGLSAATCPEGPPWGAGVSGRLQPHPGGPALQSPLSTA